VNQFPVEVGVSATPSEDLAYFDPRLYSIQLSTAVMGAEPQSVATILLHELQAAVAAATYWESVYGQAGKSRLTHPVDPVINRLLTDYLNGKLPAKVNSSYRQQCGAQETQFTTTGTGFPIEGVPVWPSRAPVSST
jgi:hypothetical protein